MTKMALRCSCGSEGHVPALEAQPWACLSGYGGTHAVQFLDAASWPNGAQAESGPLMQPPNVGESYILKVEDPFVGKLGDPFWHLHAPYDLDVSTGQDSTGKIGEIALILCEPTLFKAVDARSGYCRVKVQSSLDLAALCLLPASVSEFPDSIVSELRYKLNVLRQGQYSYVTSSVEGDLGAFAILHHEADSLELLIFGQWGFHEDFFWAGRIDVTHRRGFFDAGVPS